MGNNLGKLWGGGGEGGSGCKSVHVSGGAAGDPRPEVGELVAGEESIPLKVSSLKLALTPPPSAPIPTFRYLGSRFPNGRGKNSRRMLKTN